MRRRQPDSGTTVVRHLPIPLLACLALGAAISVLLGQDANWDLLNYHLYNGHAWLHGRFNQDLLAAGAQTYLNPLLDALYAGLALGPLHRHPRWLAAAMGLWFGLALYLATRLARLLHPTSPTSRAAALLLAATGTAMEVQIGTTTQEIPAATLMLAGLLLLLQTPPRARTLLAAGALFGLAAGLKLTATAYAPAACLAAASLHRPRRMIPACAWVGIGWLAGFAAADGWWALQLYQRFASPTFPLFNGLFRSPWFPPASVVDDRFFPRGPAQWLLYPFTWTGTQLAGPHESPFRDLRAATALALGLAATLAWLLRRPAAALTPPQRAALVFLAVGYATWLTTSSILRYAVVLEVTAGLLIPLLLCRLLPTRAAGPSLTALTLALLLTTTYLPSPRVPYGRESIRADMGWVQPGTLVVVTFRGPSAFVTALIPPQPGITIINVGDTVLEARGWPLHDEMLRRVRDHAGPIVVITQGDMQGRFAELGEIGLDPAVTHCRPIATTYLPATPTGIHACDTRKREPPLMPSPFWAQAAQRYRTLLQPVDATLSLIGAAYLRSAGPAARGTRFIDWTDLLWSGTRGPRAAVPTHPDPATLYVLGLEHVPAMAASLDPATDALGWVDGQIVAAPGWRTCPACTAPITPVRIATPGAPLALGDVALLGPAAWQSLYLAQGWWPHDPGGSWSQAQADLLLPLAPDLPPTWTLVLTGTAFTGPALPAQRIVAELPDQPASRTVHSLAGQGTIRLPIRREWLQARPDGTARLHLRLTFPDAASPAQLGMSVDPRVLGISLADLRLEPG